MKVAFFLLLQLALVTSCSTPFREASAAGPTILRAGSSREIRAAAIVDARADIAAGRPRIACTGGFASWPVGIPPEDFDLVKDLPKVPLPCGCTHPLLGPATIYAEAYNKEMFPYLLNKDQNHPNH
jgi:hypothetical protein